MEYKASVNLMNKPGNLKGFANVTIGDEFVVKGLRIIEGEKGLFVSMPSRKVGEDYDDICYPITAEAREKLTGAVMKAYEYKLSQQEGQTNEEGKSDKKSGKKQSHKSTNISESKTADKEMSEDQEEQTETGPEMSM